MLIFVQDARNAVLYPTTKVDWAEKMVRRGKAKWIRKRVIILKLTYVVTDPPRDKESFFSLGLDTGYKNIGYCLFKITGSKVQKLVSGEAFLRTDEITKLLTERKMYRQAKRRHRRNRKTSTKFRQLRWKNRTNKEKLSPTARHLIQSHINVVRFVCKLVPYDKLTINLEYAKFDTQKLTQTSNDLGLGYANIKVYILTRDGYTCQYCATKNVQLEVHHKITRSDGGTNRPTNLVTLCSPCHSKHHAGKINANGTVTRQYKDSGVLNTAMPSIYKELAKHIPTYKYHGYETKFVANTFGITKTHANDAMILAVNGTDISTYNDFKITLDLTQYRRHNRARTQRLEDRKYYLTSQLTKTKKGLVKYAKAIANNRRKRTAQTKPSLEDFRKTNPNPVIVRPGKSISKKGYDQVLFSPGDIVQEKLTKETYPIRGWASTHHQVSPIVGKDINISKVTKIKKNSGLVIN